jgi:hypothetical protein
VTSPDSTIRVEQQSHPQLAATDETLNDTNIYVSSSKTEVPALSSRWVEEAAALTELHLTQPNISLAWIACEMLMKLEAEREGFRRE